MRKPNNWIINPVYSASRYNANLINDITFESATFIVLELRVELSIIITITKVFMIDIFRKKGIDKQHCLCSI